MIETLVPGISSVTWSRGERIEFGSPLRLKRKLGVDVSALADECRTTERGIDRVFPGTTCAQRVVTIPSFGAGDVVHAVSIWVGDSDLELDDPPIVGAISVDFRSMRVLESVDDYLMHSVDTTGYVEDRDIGMFMAKVIGFPRAAELVEMCTNPQSRERFTGTLILKHDDGRLMNWAGVARIDHRANMLRGFAQDITASEGVVISTSEMARIALGASAARSSSALIGFPVDEKANPVLCYWVTSPPESLENTDIRQSWEFDENSVAALWQVQRTLAGESRPVAVPVSVRMRAPHRKWVQCDLLCSKYPAPNVGAGILVAEVILRENQLR